MVARQREPGVYVIGGGGALNQRASTRTIQCNGEMPGYFLERLAAERWCDGSELEFVVNRHQIGFVHASVPAGTAPAQLALAGPVLAVLLAMLDHGFGSVTFVLVGGTLLHKQSSFTVRDDAELEALAQPGDELRVEGRIARLIRWALPPSLLPRFAV